MRYAFVRSFHHPVRGVGAGCAPCAAAAAAARGSAGMVAVPDKISSPQTRAVATGMFVASALVGGVGFFASAPLVSTIGFGGVLISMGLLAMQPTPESKP